MTLWIWPGLFALAVALVLIRCLKGPSLPDRVIALDMFTTITTALTVIIALFLNSYILLDISLAYATLAFISVVTIARYLESESEAK